MECVRVVSGPSGSRRLLQYRMPTRGAMVRRPSEWDVIRPLTNDDVLLPLTVVGAALSAAKVLGEQGRPVQTPPPKPTVNDCLVNQETVRSIRISVSAT